MYCKYCGKPIADDSLFCQHCGKQLSKSEEPTPKNNQPSPKKTVPNGPLFQIGQVVYVKGLGEVYSIQKVINSGTVPLYQLETGKTYFENELEETNYPRQKVILSKDYKDAVEAQLYGDVWVNQEYKKDTNRQYLNEAYEYNRLPSTSKKKKDPNPIATKTADGIVRETRGVLKVIGISALVLIVFMIVFSVVNLSDLDLGTAEDSGDNMINTLNRLRYQQFWGEFWMFLKKWGVIILIASFVIKYTYLGIKWVLDNKTK